MLVRIILIIAAVVVVVLTAINAVKFVKGRNALVNCLREGNCIIFGPKGAGKDCLNNKGINARKEQCYANIPYNKEYCTERDIRKFSVYPNTYKDILNNTIKVIDKENKENCDMYISDGGIILPSQYSSDLVKNYPSLPIYYALSRHLTNSNIHINTQYLGRVWDKLREQAEFFIRAVHTKKIAIKIKNKEYGFLITDFIIYDNYQSALSKLNPFDNKRLFEGAEGAAARADFQAKHGNIKAYKVIQRISHVYYDSRHYHKDFYGYNSPDSM